MKQELMDAIQEMPVIAAVKDDAGLCSALTNENIRVVFVLYGDICNISSIVRRIHEAGRFAVVHIDLIAGLAGKEVAVDFIRNTTEADRECIYTRKERELNMFLIRHQQERVANTMHIRNDISFRQRQLMSTHLSFTEIEQLIDQM